MEIREVQRSDAEKLVCLIEQLGYSVSLEEMQKSIESYTDSPFQKAWVAEEEKAVLGCIAVAMTKTFHESGFSLRIISLVVDQGQRRCGVGKRLVQTAEKYATEKNCSQIELTSATHRAKLGFHKFYRSLGYVDQNHQKNYFVKKIQFLK